MISTDLNSLVPSIIAVASLVSAALMFLKMSRKLEKYDKFAESIQALFHVREDPETHELLMNEKLVKLMHGFGSVMANSLKMSVLGSLSGQSRLESGLKGAMTKDFIDQQVPMLKLLEPILGKETFKYITKNPEAVGQLIQLAAPLLQNINAGSLAGGGPRSNNGGGVPSMT